VRWIVALLASGCSLLNEFPDPIEENTRELCSDGADNDVDEAADCADPSCDGSCFENTLEQCTDARDNDLDGRSDEQDPTCWPFADLIVTRCSSVDGTEIVEEFEDELSVISAWYAAFGEVVVTSSGTLDLSQDQDIGTRAVFWNPWDELEMRLVVPALGGLNIAFAPESLAPADALFAPNARELLSVWLRDEYFLDCTGVPQPVEPGECPLVEGISAFAIVDGTVKDLGLAHPAVGTQEITIRIDDGALSVHIVGIDPPRDARFSLSLEGLAPPPPFRILLGGERLETTVDRVTLTTKEVHPCGAETPQIPSGGVVGDLEREFDVGTSIGAAVAPGGATCALALTCGEIDELGLYGSTDLVSFHSVDGQSWERGRVELGETYLPAGGIGWNELEQWWEIAIPFFSFDVDVNMSVPQLIVAYSRDCSEWNLLARADFPYDTFGGYCNIFTVPGEAVSYVVRDSVDRQRRELFVGTGIPECDEETCILSWVLHRAELRDKQWVRGETWPLEELQIAPPVQVSVIGSDLVLTHHQPASDGSGIGMMVWSGEAEWKRVPGFRLEPSRIPGTFDSADVLSGSLFERDGALFVMYGAIGDYYVHPITGPGHASVGIAPIQIVPRPREE
jgi:hypothetical protein